MSEKGRKRWRRRLLWALGGLVLFCGLSLIGVNLWLDTDSFSRLVNRKPDKVLIEWSHARMIVPGRVELRDLRIRGRQRRVHWYVELDEAKVSVDLWALTGKTFRTESVLGEGLRFRIRQRLKEGMDPSLLDNFPEIPGLEFEPAEPRPAGALRPPGWVIDLGGLDVLRVEEIWFNQFHLQGEGAFTGEMSFQVRGPMSFTGCALSWEDGIYTMGGEGAATELALSVDVDIDPLIPREAKGLKFLDYIVGQLKIDGEFEDAGLVQYFLQSAAIDVDAKGRLSIDSRLNRGRLEPGTTLLMTSPELGATLANIEFRGEGTIEGSVTQPSADEPPISELRIGLRDFQALGLDSDSPLTAETGVDVVIRMHDPDLRGALPDPDVHLELPDLRLPDLRAFNAVIPDGLGLEILKGQAVVRTSLDLTQSEGTSQLEVHGEKIVLDLHGRELGGGLELDVLYAGGAKGEHISIDGTRLAFGPPAADGTPGVGRWAELVFNDAELLMSVAGKGKGHKFTPADGHLEIEGRIADLGLLNEYLSYGKWLSLHGEADFDAKLHVGERSLKPGSRVELRADHLLAEFMGWEVGGKATVVADLPGPEEDREKGLKFDFKDVDIARDGDSHFSGPDLRLKTWGTDLSGGGGLKGLNVRLDLSEAEALDASLLNDYLPHPDLISLDAGDIRLEGFAEVSESAGEALLKLTAEGLEASLRGESLSTGMMLGLEMSTTDPKSRRFSLDGTKLRLDDTHWNTAEKAGATAKPWVGEFDVLQGEIELGHPPTIDGSIELTMTDTQPLMHAVFSKSQAAQWFEPWLVLHDVDGTAGIHLGADGMYLDDFKLTSDLVKLDGTVRMAPPEPGEKKHAEELSARGELIQPLKIEFAELNHLLHSQTISFVEGIGEMLGHFALDGDVASGQLVLSGPELAAKIWEEELQTDLKLDIEMQSDDLHSHRFDIGGTFLRLDDGYWLGDKFAEKHPGWWAEIRLAEGDVVLGKPLTIDTNIEIHMRDTHPLIHILATKSRAARWFHRFLEIKEVNGTARLRMGPDGIRLDDVLIEGKGLKIEGRLELGHEHEYALFHVVLHHLSASLEKRTDGHDMKLINAKHWYEKRLEAADPQLPAEDSETP